MHSLQHTYDYINTVMPDLDGTKSVESANKRDKTPEHSKPAKLKQRRLETEYIWILLAGMHRKPWKRGMGLNRK